MSNHTPKSQDKEIPYGFCHCGCGKKTTLASRTNSLRGAIAGKPTKFLTGHAAVKKGNTSKRNKRPTEDRFWEKVDKSGGSDACWNWTSGINRNGYGSFGFDRTCIKRRVTSHRMAYELTYGPIPKGLCVCHSCDNRTCCNPAHLWLGTLADNTADMMAKGRDGHGRLPGESNPRAKLTESDVREIKRRLAAGEKRRYIARDYDVTESQIGHIKAGKSWANVK